MKVKLLSHVRLLATPWTAAYQAPLSMGFARQAYWSAIAFSERSPYYLENAKSALGSTFEEKNNRRKMEKISFSLEKIVQMEIVGLA